MAYPHIRHMPERVATAHTCRIIIPSSSPPVQRSVVYQDAATTGKDREHLWTNTHTPSVTFDLSDESRLSNMVI
jgi:hypothetical protein